MAADLVARVRHASGAGSSGSDLEHTSAPLQPPTQSGAILPTAAEGVPTLSPKSVGRIAVESVRSIYWPEFGSGTAEKQQREKAAKRKAA